MFDFMKILTASAVALYLMVPDAMAQETASKEGKETTAVVLASTSTGITLGLELLDALSAEEALMAAAMEEINNGIEAALVDGENAEATFDAMVAAVERMAEFGNPEGRYVGNIEDTIALARAIAIESREVGDEEGVADMEAEIATLELMRATALELYSDSFRTIRDIEAQRSRFVLRMRRDLVTKAREIAENGLKIVRKHNSRLQEIREAAVGSDNDEVVSE